MNTFFYRRRRPMRITWDQGSKSRFANVWFGLKPAHALSYTSHARVAWFQICQKSIIRTARHLLILAVFLIERLTPNFSIFKQFICIIAICWYFLSTLQDTTILRCVICRRHTRHFFTSVRFWSVPLHGIHYRMCSIFMPLLMWVRNCGRIINISNNALGEYRF